MKKAENTANSGKNRCKSDDGGEGAVSSERAGGKLNIVHIFICTISPNLLVLAQGL